MSGEDCACGFDGDVQSGPAEAGGEFAERGEEHGLAAGEHGMSSAAASSFSEQVVDGYQCAFGLPTGVRSVAPGAAEIASGVPDEVAGNAGEHAFALNGEE